MYSGLIEHTFEASSGVRHIGINLIAGKPRQSSELTYCAIAGSSDEIHHKRPYTLQTNWMFFYCLWSICQID